MVDTLPSLWDIAVNIAANSGQHILVSNAYISSATNSPEVLYEVVNLLFDGTAVVSPPVDPPPAAAAAAAAMSPKVSSVPPLNEPNSPGPIYCPLLYAPIESSSDESEPEGPKEIKTSEIDQGDDLTDGILTVDSVRVILN
jgi:hypothetical protein